MANILFLILTICILLYRIYSGNYTVGGEIFLPLMPTFIKWLYSYYKFEKQATEQYMDENPEEFD